MLDFKGIKSTPLKTFKKSQRVSKYPSHAAIFFFAGADPNSKDYDCRTPLHSAIVKGSRSYDCVRLLLNGGADVNHKDRYYDIKMMNHSDETMFAKSKSL